MTDAEITAIAEGYSMTLLAKMKDLPSATEQSVKDAWVHAYKLGRKLALFNLDTLALDAAVKIALAARERGVIGESEQAELAQYAHPIISKTFQEATEKKE